LLLALVTIYLLVAPLDILQLVCALVGAIVYAVLSLPVVPGISRSKQKSIKVRTETSDVAIAASPSKSPQRMHGVQASNTTSVPIKAPIFTASDFDTQVDELVVRITPTASCHRAVQELTSIIRQKIQTLIPEVEVMGFATGDLQGGTAYGVAVPEVDIVANVSPTVLSERLQGRLSQKVSRQRTFTISRLDTRKLQKSAIRVCTSLLVSVGFKFRRSCFRSEEPKVTLLAPVALGVTNNAIPVDFSINNTTPLYNMALLTECGQMDPRAKSLILLVKRWAKDRGVCHASKGHLPPYAWSLLAIYFMQTGVIEADGGLPLPTLDAFAVSSGLMSGKGDTSSAKISRQAPKPQKKSMGDLFKDFVRFYNRQFDWRKEAVSVRLGKRAPPDLALDIHIVLNDDGSTAVSPIIEDPFDPKRNIGSCTNATSLKRFLEELSRADTLLSKGGSLTELLEPWRPPEHEECEEKQEEKADHGEDDDKLDLPAAF